MILRAIKRFFKALFTALLICAAVLGLFAGEYYGYIPELAVKGSYFNIDTVIAPTDYDGDSTDDYTDILKGARKDALQHPTYVDAYYEGGYPPDNEGVCTDVIWRAFKNAGYDLKSMVDADIARRSDAYGITNPDPNIDFRRVQNLSVFFQTYAQPLTTDITDIAQWQPGDIVVFGSNEHIGIISDWRTFDGIAFVIHNGGKNPDREENALSNSTVTGHYRFDATMIDSSILRAWSDT